ncbi:Lamin-like protein, partial [Mucuna pruriens]
MEILSFQKMFMMIMAMILLINMVKSELHYVGGDKTTWGDNINLTEWSNFGYDRHQYNVLLVNKTSYEQCVETGFIQNISRGAGRDVFQLKEFNTYYFISGGGHCWNGVKVAIKVTEGVAPAPAPVAPSPQSGAPSPQSAAPAPSPKHSASDAIRVNQILLVFIFFMWGISSNNISY